MQLNEYVVQGNLEIGRGTTLRIRDGRELLVYVWYGSAWLTQQGDRRDIMLRAGEWFRLDRRGLAALYALRDSAVSLTSPYAEHYAGGIELVRPGEARGRELVARRPGFAAALARAAVALLKSWDGWFAPAPRRALPVL